MEKPNNLIILKIYIREHQIFPHFIFCMHCITVSLQVNSLQNISYDYFPTLVIIFGYNFLIIEKVKKQSNFTSINNYLSEIQTTSER